MNSTQQKGIQIGNKLRQLRMNNGRSQEYMADLLDVSQKTYSNIENDKSSISIEVLKKIAAEYKVDMLELLYDGKVVVQHNSFTDTSSMQGIIYNHAQDELIQQLKERVEDLKNNLAEKEKKIATLEKLLLK